MSAPSLMFAPVGGVDSGYDSGSGCRKINSRLPNFSVRCESVSVWRSRVPARCLPMTRAFPRRRACARGTEPRLFSIRVHLHKELGYY